MTQKGLKMKNEVISIIENAFANLATDESSCLIDIFNEIEREVEILNDDFVVRKPYNTDNGRFVEIELSEDDYIYCHYKWDRSQSIHNPELKLWFVEE